MFRTPQQRTQAAAMPGLRTALAAGLLTVSTLAATVGQAAPVAGMGTWQSTLQARDINGDGTTDAFYDTVLNITWLADGNAGAGSGFDATYGDGYMTWHEAMAWAGSLNVFGVIDWRLPTMIDSGAPGCGGPFTFSGGDCGYTPQTISVDGKTVYSEWAHLYYVTLGNLAYCDENGDCKRGNASAPPGFMLKNTGDFRNLRASTYWFGLAVDALASGRVWSFYADAGVQIPEIPDWPFSSALVVHDGDVAVASPIPEPGGLALVLAALGALQLVRGRRRAI